MGVGRLRLTAFWSGAVAAATLGAQNVLAGGCAAHRTNRPSLREKRRSVNQNDASIRIQSLLPPLPDGPQNHLPTPNKPTTNPTSPPTDTLGTAAALLQPTESTGRPAAVPGHWSNGFDTPSPSSSSCPWAHPTTSTVRPGRVPGHRSDPLGTPSLSLSSCAYEHPVAPTGSPGRVPGQVSSPLGTPSLSSSLCAREHPFASTLAPASVPGQRSSALLIPSLSSSSCVAEHPFASARRSNKLPFREFCR